jgi:imidazolonepropionase-like amidohydrolase
MGRNRCLACLLATALAAGFAARIGARALALAEEAPAPAGASRTLALVGALIRTETEAGEFVGNVIIQGGKITALGPDTAIPPDARQIEVANHIISPGLIDARSVLWLNPSAAQEGGREAALNILDGVDPFADDWREVARQGVTAVYVQPAGSGSLGGSGAVLRVGPTGAVDELIVRSPAAVQAALGTPAPAAAANADRPAGSFGRFGAPAPAATTTEQPTGANALTRYAQFEALRGQFDAAKKYGESKPPHPDPAKELLLKTVKRELPVRLEVHHEDDLRNSYKLMTDMNLRVVFERVDRVRTVPEDWAAAKAGLIVGPLYGNKKSAELRKIALDGRRWAIGTFGGDAKASAWLRAHAAAAIADGYSRDRVLQALTRDAAELLGAPDKLGVLAVGRVADLAVFAGDPLDPSVSVRMTISQGLVTYDNPNAEAVPHDPELLTAKTGRTESPLPNLPERLPASYLLKSKMLLTPTGDFAPGELYVENGKLADRGTVSLSVPIIDVGDAPITPGLIAAHVAFGGEQAPDADASHLRGVDGLTLSDPRWQGYRDGGFLTTVVAPGSKNVMAGMACAVKSGEPSVAADAGLKFVLTAAARDNERYPASLVGQVEMIGDRLRGAPSHSSLYLPLAVQQALLEQREQNLAAVRAGRIAACFEAQSPTEIRAALRLITEHKLRGVLLLPRHLDDLASEIQIAGVAVVIAPMRTQDTEKTRAAYTALGKSGVPLAFGGGDAPELRTTAAWLVNSGMSRSAARRALIAQPPERFGLPPGAGRLAAGDAADLVIWDGDPLDPGRKPTAVVAKGQRVGH